MRKFEIKEKKIEEDHTTYDFIGSGWGIARDFLYNSLSGFNHKKLDKTELIFYSIAAGLNSEINFGIGGTPNITYINKEGLEVFNKPKVSIFCNITAAHLVGLVTRDYVYKTINQIIDGNVDISSVAKSLDLTEFSLTSAAIPFSTWQERAHEKRGTILELPKIVS